jgi:hypothetical protein
MNTLIRREVNKIMPHCPRTKQDVEGRVADMFRLAERDYDLDIPRLALLTGLDRGSLNNYRNGTAIPLHAFVQLARHIPDELLSLCLAPADKCVLPIMPDDADLDKLTAEAVDFAADKLRREADGVVCHIDRKALAERARRLAVSSMAVGRAA